MTKSDQLNHFMDKKECQEFADSLTPELRDLIEQIIAERVIEEFEEQKAAVHSKRVGFLKARLRHTLA